LRSLPAALRDLMKVKDPGCCGVSFCAESDTGLTARAEQATSRGEESNNAEGNP
jgi:hypothetical protein